MADGFDPEILLRRHMVKDGAFVDVAILNELAGYTIPQPKRTVTNAIRDIIPGTDLREADIILEEVQRAGRRRSITYVKVTFFQCCIFWFKFWYIELYM
jgi:hypothetical protein